MIASKDVCQQFRQNMIFTKGLYLNDSENIDLVIDITNELNYEQ